MTYIKLQFAAWLVFITALEGPQMLQRYRCHHNVLWKSNVRWSKVKDHSKEFQFLVHSLNYSTTITLMMSSFLTWLVTFRETMRKRTRLSECVCAFNILFKYIDIVMLKGKKDPLQFLWLQWYHVIISVIVVEHFRGNCNFRVARWTPRSHWTIFQDTRGAITAEVINCKRSTSWSHSAQVLFEVICCGSDSFSQILPK